MFHHHHHGPRLTNNPSQQQSNLIEAKVSNPDRAAKGMEVLLLALTKLLVASPIPISVASKKAAMLKVTAYTAAKQDIAFPAETIKICRSSAEPLLLRFVFLVFLRPFRNLCVYK